MKINNNRTKIYDNRTFFQKQNIENNERLCLYIVKILKRPNQKATGILFLSFYEALFHSNKYYRQ